MSSRAKPLILIVEDEKDLADMVAQQLELSGMLPQVFYKAAPALRFLDGNFANLMLLDVNLPDMSGFDMIEELGRRDVNVPVIFLTANSTEVYKVRGLDLGGDDYVTKPFSFPELLARIRAVLRRAETAHDQQVTKNASVTQEAFDFSGAKVSPERMEIQFPDGGTEKIGRKELGILTALVQNAGSVLTRRSLIHAVWGIHADVRSRSLDQYIVRIRNAYTRNNTSLDTFRTVHGVGYIYDPDNRRADAGLQAED